MVITPLRASPVASAPAGGERDSARDVSTLEVLRVDMTRGDFFAQVRASIRSGAVLLDEVQRCARALKEADGGRPAATESAAACRVWQCLRGGAASSQAAGDHRLATPIDLSGVTDGPEHVARLRRDAQDLCGLLRLSLCDSADLQLARSVLSDAEAFLATIEARAATTGLTPSDVWRQLQSESLPPASPAGGTAASSSARKV